MPGLKALLGIVLKHSSSMLTSNVHPLSKCRSTLSKPISSSTRSHLRKGLAGNVPKLVKRGEIIEDLIVPPEPAVRRTKAGRRQERGAVDANERNCGPAHLR